MRQCGKGYQSIDFSGIDFPSDGLTLGQIRQRHRALFDRGMRGFQPSFFWEAEKPQHSRETIGGLLYAERLVCCCAFALADATPAPACDIHAVKERLAEQYVGYGIARGEHHAQQLIRGLERQGVALAQQAGR